WCPHFQSAGRRNHSGSTLATSVVRAGAWPQPSCLIVKKRELDAVWRRRKWRFKRRLIILRRTMMQNTTREPTVVRNTEAATHNETTESLKEETLFAGVASLIPQRASRPRHTAPVSFSLPGRGLSSALIAGTIAGVLAALLTILIILINTGTFHAARLQIAVDRLTVKTAL